MTEVRDERSLGDLFNELSQETTTLVRQEVQLARVELQQTASNVGKNVAYLAVGGLILYAAFLALLYAVVAALATTMDAWMAALLVALIVGTVGAFLTYYGYDQLKRVSLVPQRTVETLEEDAEWLKRQVA